MTRKTITRLSLLLLTVVFMPLTSLGFDPPDNLGIEPLLRLSDAEAKLIGDQIWQNESNRKIRYLTHWNKNEAFGSFGIGHWIWYPEKEPVLFKETFPDLLIFLQKKNKKIPAWLRETPECPWPSREVFYSQFNALPMTQLRHFLEMTIDTQMQYFTASFQTTYNRLLNTSTPSENITIQAALTALLNRSNPHWLNGVYAVIDYAHFKGDGTHKKERYNSRGWGLKQALLRVDPHHPLASFSEAAKHLLVQRVRHSPPEKNEKAWLKGWHNRIHTYVTVQF